MKQTFLSLLLLLIATCGWAQKVWENPTSFFHYSDYFDMKISKVELSEKETVLHFIYQSRYGIKFSFCKVTSLKTPDGKRYCITGGKATNAEEKDMPVGEMYWPDTLSVKFALHFEPLPTDVERFHLIEGMDYEKNALRIFNITEGKPADMSELFNSNWRNYKTGDWMLGLYADNAVYDSKVWKYESKDDKKIVLTVNQGVLDSSPRGSALKMKHLRKIVGAFFFILRTNYGQIKEKLLYIIRCIDTRREGEGRGKEVSPVQCQYILFSGLMFFPLCRKAKIHFVFSKKYIQLRSRMYKYRYKYIF